MLTPEFGIAHPRSIVLKVVRLVLNLFGQLRIVGLDRADRVYQLLDLALIEFVLLAQNPAFLFHLLVRVQRACQSPEMLPGMIEIHDLDGPGEVLLCDVPNPVGPVAENDLGLRPAPATLPGLYIDAA